MIQQHSIHEIVNFLEPGKEQYHSYECNIEYKLFQSNDGFIYVKMDFSDMNVYITKDSKILNDDEYLFLKQYFSNFDFLITDCSNSHAIDLEKPMVCFTNNDLLKYDKVLV